MFRSNQVAHIFLHTTVFQAIKQNGGAYQFASDRLKQDEELKQLALEDDSITDKKSILEMFK